MVVHDFVFGAQSRHPQARSAKTGNAYSHLTGDCYAFSQMTAFSKVTHLIWLLFTQTFYALGDIEYMTIQKKHAPCQEMG